MKSKVTVLTAYPYMSPEARQALYPEVCQIAVEFTESGWRVIKDNRPLDYKLNGYLHIEDGVSSEEITDEVRDQIISYYYTHPRNLPGIGATPQAQYMSGVSIDERERIGNNSKRAFYC